MRIFVALDIDEAIRTRILRFMDGVREFAPYVRWVTPESMHVTLKFVGEKPAETVEVIKRALAETRGEDVDITFKSYGFFPTPKSARVFWVGIEAAPALSAFAQVIDNVLAGQGVPCETHPFSPHLTLARLAGGSGAPQPRRGDGRNRSFHHLQEKLAALPTPEFGAMTAREFFLFESQLLRGGARYTKLARFALS